MSSMQQALEDNAFGAWCCIMAATAAEFRSATHDCQATDGKYLPADILTWPRLSRNFARWLAVSSQLVGCWPLNARG